MTVTNPDSLTPFQFSTKATTLERLAGRIASIRFCEQMIVTVESWNGDKDAKIAEILEQFGKAPLAVRSSAAAEDGWNKSLAGAHLSLIGVSPSPAALRSAIDDVLGSYKTPSPADQVLIQPMVGNVVISGVVLSRDLDTGSPYFVINYDDTSGRTDTVTGGAESKAVLVRRARPEALKSPRLAKLIEGVREIERVSGSNELDIEFCITARDEVFILQVRPLAARQNWESLPDPDLDAALDTIRDTLAGHMAPLISNIFEVPALLRSTS